MTENIHYWKMMVNTDPQLRHKYVDMVSKSTPKAIPFTPLCQCLSEETLKAVGPLYLVSMPGEVKYPTSPTGMCNCGGLHHS